MWDCATSWHFAFVSCEMLAIFLFEPNSTCSALLQKRADLEVLIDQTGNESVRKKNPTNLFSSLLFNIFLKHSFGVFSMIDWNVKVSESPFQQCKGGSGAPPLLINNTTSSFFLDDFRCGFYYFCVTGTFLISLNMSDFTAFGICRNNHLTLTVLFICYLKDICLALVHHSFLSDF